MDAYDRMNETFKKLSTDRIKEIGKSQNSNFTRTRKMPFEDLALYILSQKGKTITMEINDYFKEINKRENRVTKQNFCKQRCKLNPEVFKQLGKEYVESIYENSQYKTYKGYILTAIDGTSLEIPNTKKLQTEYECQQSSNENTRTIARARGSGIYDVENNIMLDAIVTKYTTPERTLAKQNLKNMLSIFGDNKKIITIFDRGYVSIEMLLFLLSLPIKYLFRLPASTYAAERSSMKSNDEIVDIKIDGNRLRGPIDEEIKERGKLLKKISSRMVKITLSTGEEEYLLTNIALDEMNTLEIGELYFKRWGIETAYDIMKNKLYIENFSGRNKIIIEQDFYAQMLLFNMVEDLKNDANKKLELKKNKKLKYEYKVNINILIGTFRSYMIKIALEDDDVKRKRMYTYMIEEIMENLVPIRNDRQFSRKAYKGINKNKLNIRRNS